MAIQKDLAYETQHSLVEKEQLIYNFEDFLQVLGRFTQIADECRSVLLSNYIVISQGDADLFEKMATNIDKAVKKMLKA